MALQRSWGLKNLEFKQIEPVSPSTKKALGSWGREFHRCAKTMENALSLAATCITSEDGDGRVKKSFTFFFLGMFQDQLNSPTGTSLATCVSASSEMKLWRRRGLEHAQMQALLGRSRFCFVLLRIATPNFAFGGMHPSEDSIHTAKPRFCLAALKTSSSN